MNKREKTKLKVKALLAKTTENGATEEEALSALQKAQELMMENFISEHEITDPYLAEKCVFKKIKKIQSNYNLTVFLTSLAKLFDCEYYYTSTEVVFFGFEEDTELCEYFYYFIIRSCFADKDKYTRTKGYQQARQYSSGRTLVASFVRGYLIAIHKKMVEMYQARQRKVSDEVGLMVVEKLNKVRRQFQQENKVKISTVKDRGGRYLESAYYAGKDKGSELSITQGISNSKSESTRRLQ